MNTFYNLFYVLILIFVPKVLIGQCSTENTTGQQSAIGDFGQSFIAPCSGILETFEVLSTSEVENLTVELREGDGLDGNVIATLTNAALRRNESLTDYSELNFSALDANLVSGSLYTIVFTDVVSLGFGFTDTENNGKLYFNEGDFPSRDLLFVTNISAEDNTPPTVNINSQETNPTENSNFQISVIFSEPVTGLIEDDFVVNNGSLSNLTGQDANYTAEIMATAFGTITIDLPINSAIDTGGNGNIAATQFSIEYTNMLSNEIFNPLEITIFPNPAQDVITINSLSTFKEIIIYSLTGRKVLDTTSSNISLKNLESGVYFLLVVTNNGKGIPKKFIKI